MSGGRRPRRSSLLRWMVDRELVSGKARSPRSQPRPLTRDTAPLLVVDWPAALRNSAPVGPVLPPFPVDHDETCACAPNKPATRRHYKVPLWFRSADCSHASVTLCAGKLGAHLTSGTGVSFLRLPDYIGCRTCSGRLFLFGVVQSLCFQPHAVVDAKNVQIGTDDGFVITSLVTHQHDWHTLTAAQVETGIAGSPSRIRRVTQLPTKCLSALTPMNGGRKPRQAFRVSPRAGVILFVTLVGMYLCEDGQWDESLDVSMLVLGAGSPASSDLSFRTHNAQVSRGSCRPVQTPLSGSILLTRWALSSVPTNGGRGNHTAQT
jgi:hypothetical protein